MTEPTTPQPAKITIHDETTSATLRALLDDLDRERAAHESRRLALSEAFGLGTGADWNAIVDRAGTVRAAATERADLLEEARDALEQAGQNGAHGDDWPAIAPAIQALAKRAEAMTAAMESTAADALAHRGCHRKLMAQCQRAETAETALARVRALRNRWATALGTDRAYAHALNAALDGDQPAEAPPNDERCVVCGATGIIHQVVDRRRLCSDCFLCRCGETPCVRTGVNDPEVSDLSYDAKTRPKRPGIFAGVQGHCPACGHTALILGTGGYITCGNLDCPDPEAATNLLEQPTAHQPLPEPTALLRALHTALGHALGVQR